VLGSIVIHDLLLVGEELICKYDCHHWPNSLREKLSWQLQKMVNW